MRGTSLGGLTGVFILFGLAGAFTFGCVTETIWFEYSVEVSAPDTLEWILWIPHTQIPVAASVPSNVHAIISVEHPDGRYDNISGRGPVKIAASWSRTIFLFQSVDAAFPYLFSVWRNSSDPAAQIVLFAGTFWSATRLGVIPAGCGGSGLVGDAQEGWGTLGSTHPDCFPGLIPIVLTVGPAAAFWITGSRTLERALRSNPVRPTNRL